MQNDSLTCKVYRQVSAKQNEHAPAPELPQDIRELADLWDRLPDAVRSGFLATARALAPESRADA